MKRMSFGGGGVQLDTVDMHDLMVIFSEKYQTVETKQINEVYGGPPTMLVHHRHLRLNLTTKIFFWQRRTN